MIARILRVAYRIGAKTTLLVNYRLYIKFNRWFFGRHYWRAFRP